jgi:hypothetical protein
VANNTYGAACKGLQQMGLLLLIHRKHSCNHADDVESSLQAAHGMQQKGKDAIQHEMQ